MRQLDFEDFAKLLMDPLRKKWQDPESIIEQIGIQSGWAVADLGCGPGYFTTFLSQKVGKDGMVYAVDASSVMLEYLASNLVQLAPSTKANVNMINSEASNTSIPDHSVDCVLFANILHDIDDKRAFLAEVRRILRKQSSLVVDVDWHKRDMDMGPPKEIRLTEAESRKLLNDSGFRIVHLINAGPHHYGFVATLPSTGRKKAVGNA